MFSEYEITKILSVINTVTEQCHPTVVGIDGMTGAGKSTLASQLTVTIPEAITVELDDFYRPIDDVTFTSNRLEDSYHAYFDWQRLIQKVLVPIREGRNPCYRRFDWETNHMAEVRKLTAGRLILIDGVYAIHSELRPYIGVKLYVETPKDFRFLRILDRGYKDLSWVKQWMTVEDWYIEHQRPHDHADLVIKGF